MQFKNIGFHLENLPKQSQITSCNFMKLCILKFNLNNFDNFIIIIYLFNSYLVFLFVDL